MEAILRDRDAVGFDVTGIHPGVLHPGRALSRVLPCRALDRIDSDLGGERGLDVRYEVVRRRLLEGAER